MAETNLKPRKRDSFLLRIASFIVDRRNLLFLLFAIITAVSAACYPLVKVENDIKAYLPDDSETAIGLDIMNTQFVTYGSAKVMIDNISFEDAEDLSDRISNFSYVSLVQFDASESHYNNFSALYNVTFPYSETDDRCLEYVERLKNDLSDYDAYISTTMGDQASVALAQEVSKIIVYVAIIILVVLIFTSTSYAEVPVLIITFVVSAVIAMGSNFLLGTISFVSNSVAIVLQLALSIDYAVIYINRYKNERLTNDVRNADIIALSKAIPEISASSLTTIGGLIAMAFMQFGIGPDLAIVLIKAIFISLITVFGLMPGLIMLFANLMEKTTHRNFVPKVPFIGKFAYYTRMVIPFIFICIIGVACYLSSNCLYAYGENLIDPPTLSAQMKIDRMMDNNFGRDNVVAVIVPAGNYDKEAELAKIYENQPQIKSVMGLSNTVAMDDVTLTQKLKTREFAELIDVDTEIATLIYTAYAIDNENYARLISGINDYSVPFIDMFKFLHAEIEEGYVELDEEEKADIDDAFNSITIAEHQLQGTDYSRMLVYLNLPEEGDETFQFLDYMHTLAYSVYGDEIPVYVIGNSTSEYDLCKTFERDNTIVNIISVLAVLVVLLFTFKSCGMPILLIIVIEGCIWINFSFSQLTNTYVFFLSYLVVSSIQMGANIDYAIVVSSRYQEVKNTMSKKDAIVDTMNFALPTIITSGIILASAGILIGQLTSMVSISGVGQCLGRGTIISIIAVLFVLPQLLLLGEKIIEKTSFDVNLALPATAAQVNTDLVRVDGLVQGQINGYVVGKMNGLIRGDVNVQVIRGSVKDSTLENTDKKMQQELDSVVENYAANEVSNND